ncbi:MAG: DNA repair protein RecO [Defluviitaleaceae bacterium]|nr:DNA repair protein RecO [Defluviitaleaceae bacterium]
MASNTIKARGIIIKETAVGETDKYLTIFTKDTGKLIVRARGAKNAKSKYLTAQLFAYCDFVLYQGRGFYSLTQVELIESFYNLRLDYERLMLAYDIISLVDKYIPTGHIELQESQDILLLVLKAISKLTKKTAVPELVVIVFQLKFLQITGFAPNISNTTSMDNNRQDIAEVLEYIMSCEISKVYNFSVEKDIEKGLERVCKQFLPKLELELN